MNVLFSIIVPAYNAEKFIGKAIDSVLKQSYKEYELILVDDGSVDQSGEICDTYAMKDERIHVVHQKNQGEVNARREGIKKAKGDYYIFLDSDDTLCDNALQVLYDAIMKYHMPECVIYGYQTVSEFGTVDIVTENHSEYVTDNKRDIFRKVLFDGRYNALWRKAVRVGYLPSTDISKYKYLRTGGDFVQSWECYKLCRKIVFISDVLYNYYDNPRSVMHTVEYDNYSVDFTLTHEVLEYLKTEEIFDATDMEDYRRHQIQGTCFSVRRIARFHVKQKQKNELYSQMQADWYYTQFLVGTSNPRVEGIVNKLVWFFYTHKFFFMLSWMEKAIAVVRKFLRCN